MSDHDQSAAPPRQTRKPTGKPGWPMLLIAGVQKSGKTYALAEASASDLVGRTFWISYGEIDADEYGALPGADYEIVDHNGTYRDLLGAIEWATRQPRVDGKPNLVGLDSDTRVWSMLTAQAQQAANARREKKGRSVSEDDADITIDLWNITKDRWAHIHDALRENDGPTIVTARLELVVVVDAEGRPTKERIWKVQAEKNLPFEADVIVQMRREGGGENYLTGVRSLRFRPSPTEYVKLDDYVKVDDLWRKLGLADITVERAAANPVVVESYDQEELAAEQARQQAAAWAREIAERRDALLVDIRTVEIRRTGGEGAPLAARLDQIKGEWASAHDGEDIKATTAVEDLETLLKTLSDEVAKQEADRAEADAQAAAQADADAVDAQAAFASSASEADAALEPELRR